MPRFGKHAFLWFTLPLLVHGLASADDVKGKKAGAKVEQARGNQDKPAKGQGQGQAQGAARAGAVKTADPDEILRSVVNANAQAQAALKTASEQRQAAEASAADLEQKKKAFADARQELAGSLGQARAAMSQRRSVIPILD